MLRSSHSMASDAVNASKNHVPVSRLGAVSCSVCLETVSEDACDRSIAKLKCGHHFHLDCIGSAFNAKGRMQCPNCRHVEQGQWLYANGCFLHEEFVDDFSLEEDIEAYSGAMNMQFSPTPWCPHQGSYAHFSLSFEELDNLSSGYVEPAVNMRVGSRVPAAGGPICPYLAAHGLSMGAPSPHMEDFFGLHAGQQRHFGRNSRRHANPPSGHRNYGSQQSTATSSSSMPTLYEGSSQTFHRNVNFLQPNGVRQRTLGFLIGNPQALNTGVTTHAAPTHPANLSNSHSGQVFGQSSPHVFHAQGAVGHSRGHPMPRNGYMNSNWTRNNDMVETPHRPLQIPSLEGTWSASEPVHEYGSAMLSSATAQTSNLMVGDGLGWAAPTSSPADPWTAGVYAGRPSSNQWWAWVPPTATHNQRLLPTGVPSNYQHEAQFFGPGIFPRTRAGPSAGFHDQSSQGPYAWVISGFH